MISDGPGCKEILSSHIIRTNMRRQSILKEAIPNSRPKILILLSKNSKARPTMTGSSVNSTKNLLEAKHEI